MQQFHPNMVPPSVMDTLTVAEMGIDTEKVARAVKSGWRDVARLERSHHLVYFRVGLHVVKGWLSTQFRCRPRTYWTWDERFAVDTPEGGKMPGNIEPIGYCEIQP